MANVSSYDHAFDTATKAKIIWNILIDEVIS